MTKRLPAVKTQKGWSPLLKRFTVRNYKNFKDEICLDFSDVAGYQFNLDCIHNGLISKMIIYGRNATGKTNLASAILDISFTLIGEPRLFRGKEIMLNADSAEKTALFQYEFSFGETEIVYEYAKESRAEIKWEKLSVDGAVIFECDFTCDSYNFSNLKKIGAGTVNTEIYRQSIVPRCDVTRVGEVTVIPFLRWLFSNAVFAQDSAVTALFGYVTNMDIVKTQTTGGSTSQYDRFFKTLENSNNLHELEEFFNAMGIACRLELKKLPDGQYDLYFAHERKVPFFSTASSGTLALFELYRRIIYSNLSPSLLYMDEFDAFYHYEMSENLVRFLKKKYPKCQIILTTHNTNLMSNRIMRPDCLFILSRSGTLTALCSATERELREGHNLEKMYKAGEFDRYE